MLFAQRTFTAAGIYGILVLTPFYFLERYLNENQPPPITHPEFFYGFVGVALAWQVAFIIIGRDPIRFRPLIPACIIEKLSYTIATIVLYVQSRIAVSTLAFGLIDLLLGTLFLISYVKTRAQ
jgi:hypothetical protein